MAILTRTRPGFICQGGVEIIKKIVSLLQDGADGQVNGEAKKGLFWLARERARGRGICHEKRGGEKGRTCAEYCPSMSGRCK